VVWDARIIGRQHLVVLVNQCTLVTLVIPWTEFKKDPAVAVRMSLQKLLQALNIPKAMIDEELATITNVTFTKTAPKTMLGRMNAPAFTIERMVESGLSFDQMNIKLASCLYTPSKADPEWDYFTADRRTYMLFGLAPSTIPTYSERASLQAPPPMRSTLTDAFILRIELDGIRPEIWRTVMVPVNITMRRLHDVIQAAMG